MALSSTSTASTWGSTGANPWGTPTSTASPSLSSSSTTAPAPAAGAAPIPTTFSQMQQQGIARPAPVISPTSGGLVGATASALTPGTGPSLPTPPVQPPTPPLVPGQGATPGQPWNYSVQPTTPAIGGALTSAVEGALKNPSPYSSAALEAARSSGNAQLEEQFGAQRKHLDEEMARRGVGASSIAGGYYGDLAGQQATAKAGLESSLLTDMASRNANDQAVALGAGQGLYNTQAGQGLGWGQLGLQGYLGQGALGLGQSQLAQQLGIAQMGDVTANRGIDVQGQSANAQLAALLAALGYSGQAGAVAGGATPGGTAPPNPYTPHTPASATPPGTTTGRTAVPTGGATLDPSGSSGLPGAVGPALNGSGDMAPVPEGGSILPNQVAGALGAGNAGAPAVPGTGTPNAPSGPMGPSGQQQGPSTASTNFAVSNPSPDAPSALTALASTTGVDASKFGFGPNTSVAEIDAARGLMSAIGNRDPAGIQAGMTSTNPFIRRTAYAYNMGYGSQGLPDAVAQQLGIG